MRKNSTDMLMTLNFWRMCTANLLLFASVYMLFPVLSFVMPEQLGVSVSRTGDMFLAFIAAMFAAGPFHAYLCDEYKRKNVLLSSAFVMLAAMAGYAFADSYLKLMLLASVQGVCFGLATTAGITVAIDITTSTRRSAGNMIYAWSARLGMLAGACAGFLLYDLYGFRTVVYAAVAVGVLGMYFASRGICGFPCAYRDEAVQPGPLPAAACMGSCTEYAADSFRAGRIAATALYRRLHRIPDIGGVGVSDAAVYKDVRKTVSSLPAGNGQHDLPPGYGNRTFGGSGNGLPPGRCVPALPRRRCSRHTCLVLLRPADVSLL